MQLYFSPGACSLADHIALRECGIDFDIEAVNLRTKRTADGSDFTKVNAKGYVPALVLDSGDVLTENIAVLDWIGNQHAVLIVGGPLGRTRVLEALTFISTELHRAFKPMWHAGSDAERSRASRSIIGQFAYLEATMVGSYLFSDRPSVADFYLFVMLLWAEKFSVPVPDRLSELAARLRQRPAVRTAMEHEGLV